MSDKSLVKIENKYLAEIIRGDRLAATVPKVQEILLADCHIAGCSFVENIDEIFEELEAGARLTLIREKNNPHDSNAILVNDKNGRKLGYVPRRINPSIAVLMDNGKNIYADAYIYNDEERFSIRNAMMKIYMRD